MVPLTELCSFWYALKDLFTLHNAQVSGQNWLAVKTDDVIRDKRDLDPHGWLLAAQGQMGLYRWVLYYQKIDLLIC